MKKIPSFNAFFTSILMVLFAVSATWAEAVSLAEDGDDGSLYVNLPTTGTNTLEIGTDVTSFKVYDDGGRTGNYTLSASLDGALTMLAPEGYVLQVSGSVTTHYSNNAYITIYDGSASAEALLSNFGSQTWGVPRDVPTQTSSGRMMTIRFRNTAINYSYEGLDLTVTLKDASIAHEITFENQGQGGTISTTNTNVLAGETVSLNIQPSTDYLMSGVSVTGENGRSLKFTGGEWYTDEPLVFTMPYADVTVTPTYTDNLTDAGGLYINMPATGTTNAQIPGNVQSFKVYDDGGRTGTHKAGADGYLVLTAPEGYVFRLTGTVTSYNASLSIYDGIATASNLKKKIEPTYGYSATDVGDFFGTSQILTLYFKSTGSSYAGLDLTLSLGEYVDYTIATTNTVGNGSVEIAENAKPGDVVTVTATPQANHVFSGIKVVDANGNVIETNKNGDVATFIMPFADVTITPYFAASTVSFDNSGCLDPDGGNYFRVECSSQSCTISQGAFIPGDNDYLCWSELATKVVSVLGRNWSTIKLGSDLYLGGYDSGSDACVMSDFSALYTKEFEGYGHTVYGFCHITADSSGFLQSGVSSITRVSFVDAYVRGDSAGVLGSSQKGEVTWSSVTVNNATVVGNTVGALAGHLNISDYGYVSRLSNVTITNSSIIASPVTTADSVYAGVVAGKGSVGGYGATITLSSNNVSADASIASSTVVSLGGVVGELVSGRESLPNTFRISDITISNASSATEVNIGGFAGLFVEDYSTSSQTLERFGFEGSISGGTNVGGIFGKVNLPNNSLTIKNTYSRGSISGSDDALKGYIVGSLSANSKVVYNNYHVGSDVIVQGIGNGYNANSWKSGDEDVFGNVRNASGALATDGAMGHYMHSDDMYYYLDYFAYSTEQEGGGEDPVVVRLVGVVRNGIADEDDMKTDMFAALMNKNPVVQDGGTPNADEHNVWTRTDELNGDFPTFADDEHLPNHVVSIDWDGSWGLNSTQMSTLGFERWNAYFFDDDYGYYQAIYGYTDATQHVSSGLVNKLNALVSAVETSSGAEAGSLLLVDGNGLDVTSTANATFSSDQSLTIKGVQNISIVYNYCTEPASCTPFESLTDKTFIFMSPKVNTISSSDDGSYQLLPLVVDLGGTDDAPSATRLRLSVKLYDEDNDEITLPSNWTYHSNFWLVSEISQFVRSQNNTVSKIELNYQSGSSDDLYVYVSDGPTIDAYGVDADGESVRVFSSPNTSDYVTVPNAMGVRAYDFDQRVGYELEGTYTATYEYYDGTYDIDNTYETVYESTEDHAFGSIATLLQKMLSNVRLHLSVNNLTATDTVNLNNVKIAFALAMQQISTSYDASGSLRIAADYSPINYNVSFDLNLPAEITDSAVVFLGNGWNNPKGNVTIEDGQFPKVYTTRCPTFGGWAPTNASAAGTYVLNADFLTSAVVDADNNTTAYGTWASDNCTTPHTLDFSYWAQHEGEDMGLPGSVILKQVLSTTDTISHPMVAEYDDDGYPTYYTTLPDVDDTLTFIVKTDIERGYKISGIELQRTFKTGVNENTSIAFNAPEGGDTTLTINTSMLNSAGFNISFDYERFLVGFKRPTDNDAVGVTGVDYYVAEEYTAENWPDVKNYGLGDANLDMPKLYALNGCVGWSEEPSYDGEHAVYRKFDGTVAQAYVNNMVLYPVYFTPTDNPNLCGDAPTDVFLIEANVNIPEGLDHLELLQIIGVEGDGAHPDTIKHVMTQDDQDPTLFTLQVPKVSLSQAVAEEFVPFTFEIHAVPVEGYSTYSGSYYKEMTQEGNATLKVVIDNGILTTNGHYESFKVDLIGNLSYPLAFDTDNWNKITSLVGDVYQTLTYELYVSDDDLVLPESYTLGETALKLPKVYAATMEGGPYFQTNYNKSYAILGWTVFADSAYCVEGQMKTASQHCLTNGKNLFTEFSGDMIVTIQKAITDGEISVEDDSIHLYPVWTRLDDAVAKLSIGCGNDVTGCGAEDRPITVTLSQTINVAGKPISLTYSSDSLLVFPRSVDSSDDFTLNVSYTSNPGYDVSSIKLNTSIVGGVDFEPTFADGKLYLKDKNFIAKFVPDEFSLVDYTVTFDISSLKDSLVVLGKSWMNFDGTKTMNVGDKNEYPKIYVFTDYESDFNEVFWANAAKKETDFDDYSDWNEWYWTYVSGSAVPKFNSDLIKNVLGEETSTEMTLYPVPVLYLSDDYSPRSYQYIDAVLDGVDFAEESDFHGHIVLTQTWNGITFKQKSSLSNYHDSYELRLKLPWPFDDTLEFKVVTEPDPGYEMVLFGQSIDDAPEGEGWGYNAETGVLKISDTYKSDFTVRYIQQHYDVNFTIPTDAELFVANKKENGQYIVDWFDTLSSTTSNTLRAPVVFDANGCRVNWKVRDSEEHSTMYLDNELYYMTSLESSETAKNVLLPDVENPVCPTADGLYFYKQILTVEGEGVVRLEQVLNMSVENEGVPTQIVLSHSFVEDDVTGEKSLIVPVTHHNISPDTAQTGVKFSVVAEPAEGYVLDKLTYETSKNGNYIIAELEDGDSLNVMESLVFNAKFKRLAPIYVTYDLSLSSAEDTANTYLPVSAKIAETLEIATDADSVAFWKPYRTDKCFAGWSTKTSSNYTVGDSLYTVFNSDNFSDFSTISDNPTTLYAVWQECSGSSDTPMMALSNGSDHATLVIYQTFGNDTLRHEVSNDGFWLAGDSMSFRIDESRSAPEFGYKFANDAEYTLTYFTILGGGVLSDDVPVVSEDGVWTLTTDGIDGEPNYGFKIETEQTEYVLVFDVNTDAKVFYGRGWSYGTALYNVDRFGDMPKIARMDACFIGWSTDRNATEGYKSYSDGGLQLMLSTSPAEELTFAGDVGISNEDSYTANGYILYAVWDEYCSEMPATYAFVTDIPAVNGHFKIYQAAHKIDFGLVLTAVVDSSAYELNGSETLTMLNDPYADYVFEFVPGASRLTDDSKITITYSNNPEDGRFEIESGSRWTLADTVPNTNLLANPVISVTNLETDAYEFVFVENADDNVVFYGSDWTRSKQVDVNDETTATFPSIYRAGAKVAGWSFSEDSEELFQAFDATFADAYNAYVQEHGEAPDTLYAVWEENHETPKISMYLSSEAAEAGKLSLTQLVEEDTVKIDVSGSLEIPAVEGLAFAVNYTTDSAHSIAAAEKPISLMGDFGVVAQIDNGELVTIDDSYLNLSSIEVRVTPTIDEYEFVFDINVDEEADDFYGVYYGTNWKSTATYSMDEEGHRFPTSAYQQSNCLAGFYFEPMEPLPAGYTMTMPDVKFYTGIDSEFVADYKKLGRQLDTLYAVWYQPGEKCQQQLVMVGTTNSATEGTFTLTNAGKAYTVPAAEEESVLGVPLADDLEFGVLFTAGDTYDDYGNNEISIKMGKLTESHTNGEAYIFTRDASLVADPTLKMTEFELAFAENADGATLFYGENWFAGKAYDISDAEASLKFPTSLYRTDKCLNGFAFEDSDPTVTYRELSEDFVTRFKAEDYSSPLTLYAVWGDCSEPRATYTITAANDTTEGKFVLTNSFGDSINNEYEFDNLSSLVVPAEEDLKFKVTFTENAAFDYTGKVDVYDAANTETALARVNDGESYIFTGSAATQQLHAVVELKTKTFVLKVEDDHVFYPSDFAGFEWTPTSYGDTLPTNVYAVGFKVVGWSVGTVSGAHAKFDNAFVEAYKQSLEEGETPEQSDTLFAAWDSDDETGTYTIYFDSDEAGSLTLKNGAAGVENEFQIGGGLEVPAKDNLVFSVNFVADNEHTIKNGRPVKLLDVNGTIIDSIANGGTFELTQTTHIAVETSEDVYHFAFDANAATGDTVFYGTNWFSEKEYDFTGDRNFYFPTSAYQTGKCLAGFTFDAAGTGDVFTKINDDFIVAYRAIEGTKPSTLYAVWTTPDSDSDCDPQVVTVKTNNTVAEGAFTLVNGDNSYSVSDEEMTVPYAADLAFTVQFTAGQAYHLSYEDKIRILDEYGEFHGSVSVGDEIHFNANTILNAEVYLNSMGLVLAVNADTVFYGRDYNSNLFNLDEGDALPTEIYRTNAVLKGWSFKKGVAEGEPILKFVNEDFVNAYKKHVESRESFDTPDTLYALWTPSSNRETVTVSVENKESEGSMRLTNFYDDNFEEFFVAGGSSIVIPKESDLEFTVDFFAESDNVEYSYINVVSPNGTINETFSMGATRTFSEDVRLKAQSEIGSLELVLNVNAGDANVFYGRDFEFRWWGSSYGEELPKGIYRADAKLVGWSFKKNAKASEAYKEIDDRFVEEYEAYMQNLNKEYEQRMKEFEAYMSSLSPAELAKLDQYAFEEYQMKFFEDVYPVLYAVWDTKATVPTHTLVSNSLKQGTLTIVQEVSDSTFAYVVGKDGLKIPTALDDEIFAMGHFEPNPSWLLMGKRPLVWASASGADSTENDFYGDLNEMPKSLTFSVIAKYIGFHLVFNVNSKDSLFFGDDWKSEGDFIATAEETMLPAMVYNSDRCLAGWSVKPDGKTSYTVMGDALADELYATYPKLDDTTKVNLYARFTDSLELCAGELTRVAIEQDKGSVMLVENTGSGEAVHKFNDKGTMLIPMDIVSLEWTVRSVPDSSYELGSVSITRNEKVMSILHEGEHLPGSLEGALLTAVFEKSNKTPIQVVDTSFVQSGNAIQLSFKASDFEVTRGVSARVQLIDMATDAVVVDSLLGDSVAMGYADEVVLRVSRTGNYKVALILEDSLEAAEYAREFSVVNEIASIDVDSWQMLSVAAVDTSKIDTADQIFYWWDEVGGTGEYWQYKQFSVGDSIVPTRGAWYNSLEGKSLVLRKDIEDDGKDIVWNLDSVNTGWNLVANTHGWAVDLYSYNADQRKDVDEESDVTFWRYNAKTGDYDSVLTMQPYEAVWAKVTKKTTWNISAKPVFEQESDTVDTDSVNIGDPENPLLLKRVLAKTSTKERWTLQAVLSDRNGKRDAWNILGAGPNPFNAEEPPESMGDHVNLSIVEGKRAFAKSIKPHSDDMEWTVSLSASTGRIGYLSLVGIEGVKAYGYRVYVTVDGNTTEMQEGTPLKVYLKESAKTATVRVVPATRVVAESSLKGLRMARLGGKLQVSFDATGLAGTNARVDLLDMKGHVMATVAAKTVEGSNALVLDAPKSGLYMLRVRAGSQQQATKVMVK